MPLGAQVLLPCGTGLLPGGTVGLREEAVARSDLPGQPPFASGAAVVLLPATFAPPTSRLDAPGSVASCEAAIVASGLASDGGGAYALEFIWSLHAQGGAVNTSAAPLLSSLVASLSGANATARIPAPLLPLPSEPPAWLGLTVRSPLSGLSSALATVRLPVRSDLPLPTVAVGGCSTRVEPSAPCA